MVHNFASFLLVQNTRKMMSNIRNSPFNSRQRQMGTTIRQLQERVRELEHLNRMQAVEMWQLKEEKRDLEKKVESLLNADSGPPDVSTAEEETPTLRRVSFGSTSFSDGTEKREVDGGDAVEDVEEVGAETIQQLSNTGEKPESGFACVEIQS